MSLGQLHQPPFLIYSELSPSLYFLKIAALTALRLFTSLKNALYKLEILT